MDTGDCVIFCLSKALTLITGLRIVVRVFFMLPRAKQITLFTLLLLKCFFHREPTRMLKPFREKKRAVLCGILIQGRKLPYTGPQLSEMQE
jgi:hypothetical protein